MDILSMPNARLTGALLGRELRYARTTIDSWKMCAWMMTQLDGREEEAVEALKRQSKMGHWEWSFWSEDDEYLANINFSKSREKFMYSNGVKLCYLLCCARSAVRIDTGSLSHWANVILEFAKLSGNRLASICVAACGKIRTLTHLPLHLSTWTGSLLEEGMLRNNKRLKTAHSATFITTTVPSNSTLESFPAVRRE